MTIHGLTWDGSNTPWSIAFISDVHGNLQALDAKQRHEVRRKFRKLEAAGCVSFRVLEEPAAVQSALGLTAAIAMGTAFLSRHGSEPAAQPTASR